MTGNKSNKIYVGFVSSTRQKRKRHLSLFFFVHLWTDDDVVDRNMDQFNKEADETHDGKTDSSGHGDFLKFFSKGKKIEIDFDQR